MAHLYHGGAVMYAGLVVGLGCRQKEGVLLGVPSICVHSSQPIGSKPKRG